MNIQDNDQVRAQVRSAYAQVARGQDGCGVGCCGTQGSGSLELGYSADELASVPEGADLGLGCGNPQAIAALQPGETVLDLGSGAGFDCFLAAKAVGRSGRVIGVDMTSEMVTKARDNARRVEANNVDFRLGEIEHLPILDATIDAILSNCVINLSPDKEAVFREAFRVLKPGGRLAISDVIATRPMPPEIAKSLEAYTGCVAGAVSEATLRRLLGEAGFEDVVIQARPGSGELLERCMPGSASYVASAIIEGRKPGAQKSCCGPTCCAPAEPAQ
ncbi:MAG: arsenite methyltransferase [Myxococcota bacterium]|jgi:arsenite methyltransferase|nr:arsenite methyltransferase [Myxococcota bacterium]